MMRKMGIKFDVELEKQHKDIHSTRAENNSGMCGVCFCGFEEDEPELQALSLKCKHQFCVTCWGHFLKGKVESDGPACVFTTCPQLKCNMKVPHSFFKQYINANEGALEKYQRWHIK
mmetsp:Transcript_40336/g.61551  ORF Transcript_40336/g.61551 Transcript_40336/m.61551 type:complete len:117 (-) Transcript_40336:953-1303(-)